MKLPPKSRDYNLYLAGHTVLPLAEPAVPPSPTPLNFFIQFTKALTLDEKMPLQKQHGFEFKRYIPNFAFLAPLNNEKWISLKQN